MATRTLPLRLDDQTIARLDRLAEVFTSRSIGAEATRTAVMRLALQKGIELYEVEFDVVATPKKSRTKPKRK